MAYTNIIDNIDFVDNDEKHYFYDYIDRNPEEDITILLEKRAKLKKRKLILYKDVDIRLYPLTIYKKLSDKPIRGYYTTTNGLFCINKRDLRIRGIFESDYDKIQEDLRRFSII